MKNDINGIGIDIVEIKRFKKYRSKNDIFLKRYFSKQEIDYCFSKSTIEESIAARFAAKEAAVKAMYSIGKVIGISDAEVIVNSWGVPEMLIKKYKNISLKIKVSMSHTQDSAVAVVVIYY